VTSSPFAVAVSWSQRERRIGRREPVVETPRSTK
jgi:hypothetical protein